ncbi:MAG: hypothetical protein K2Q21_07465 [Chitinophagaceae bacterium]|nr:hypothetical protein [Chitinophagaceae bacterium]
MKSKKIFFLALLLSLTYCSFGQHTIERYCEISTNQLLKTTVNFGSIEFFDLKDTALLAKQKTVERFTNPVDILNYMNKTGWTLINITIVNTGKFFYFKKIFNSSELK